MKKLEAWEGRGRIHTLVSQMRKKNQNDYAVGNSCCFFH